MKIRFVAIFLCLIALMTTSVLADSKEAARLFAKGNEQLSEADFDDAAKTYAEAAAADPGNAEYLNQARIVSRVVTIRGNLKEEKDPKRWEAMARALHSYYCSNDLYSEAKLVDRQLFDRLKNEDTASMLAETLLELNDNKEAEKILKPYQSQNPSAYSQMLYGITLVRLDRGEEAHGILHDVTLQNDSDVQLRFQGARLNALMGHGDVALSLLTNVFESIPPSRLPEIKEYVRNNKDFSSITGSDKFASVLKTKSKIAESSCSGGTSCGGCPKASSCGSAGRSPSRSSIPS